MTVKKLKVMLDSIDEDLNVYIKTSPFDKDCCGLIQVENIEKAYFKDGVGIVLKNE